MRKNRRRTRNPIFPALFCLTGIPWFMGAAHADEVSSGYWQHQTLTGDWGGRRALWEKNGVLLETAYTGEAWHNTRGGIDRGSALLDNLDVTFTLDAETLLGQPGGTFFFYFLGDSGGSPSDHVGDSQTVSNIDAPDTFKLYEAWYEQRFGADDDSSLLFGLYDLNSEFDVIPSGGLFILSSHGIGPDFSQSGVNGPSIFPTAALGLRFGTEVREMAYFQAGVWDGVPGNPNDPHGTHILLNHDDGLLLTVEAGLLLPGPLDDDERPNAKLALGHWRYSAAFPDLTATDGLGNPVQRKGNQGSYLIGEYAVIREAGAPRQGLSLFARLGRANDDLNPIARYHGFGMVYTGLLPARDYDRLGLALAGAENGAKYRAAAGVEARETIVEFTYRAVVFPWLAIQPDVQYVINPGSDPALDNALVVGVRVEAVL